MKQKALTIYGCQIANICRWYPVW